MMKKIAQHPYFSVAFLVVSIFICLMIVWQDQYVTHFAATEISLEEVPESIRTKMKDSLEKGGAYFYREENQDTVYALLTAGKVLGRTIEVSPISVDEGVFFSVNFVSTENLASKLQYKVFKTSASAVSGDEYKLKNPYAKPGATGFNVGVLKNMSQGYYIIPLMDLDSVNRVYVPSEKTEKLADGLYRFTYETSSEGAKLLTAEPVKSQPIRCVITSFTDGPNPQITTVFGEDNLKLTLLIPPAKTTILEDLRKVDFSKESAIACVGVSFANQPVADDVTIMSFEPKTIASE